MKTIKIYIALSIIVILQLVLNFYFGFQVFTTQKSDRSKKTTQKEHTHTTEDHHTGLDSGRVKGCDFSHWNGEVNWSELKKDNIRFVYIKATQGNTYVDPSFEYNWASAENYGFIRGAYHFYQPGIDPIEQAEHFITTIQPEKGDLLPVLDIEIADHENPEQLTKDVKAWIEKVYQTLGRYPMIYTDNGFWNSAIDETFSHCPLWIAEWGTAPEPQLPNGWSKYDFWQYSASGTLLGVPSKGKVDLDYFNGGIQGLKLYQIR